MIIAFPFNTRKNAEWDATWGGILAPFPREIRMTEYPSLSARAYVGKDLKHWEQTRSEYVSELKKRVEFIENAFTPGGIGYTSDIWQFKPGTDYGYSPSAIIH